MLIRVVIKLLKARVYGIKRARFKQTQPCLAQHLRRKLIHFEPCCLPQGIGSVAALCFVGNGKHSGMSEFLIQILDRVSERVGCFYRNFAVSILTHSCRVGLPQCNNDNQ